MPKKPSKRKKFDWRWVVFILLLAGVLVSAIFINMHSTDHSASKIEKSIIIDNSDQKVNWDRYQTTDIKLTESLDIVQSGTYHLTGQLENGSITINAGVNEIRLILDNVTIHNPTGPAIICYNAENLVIELVGENNLSDGENYSSEYDQDVRGVIYSKAELAFGGTGSLILNGNYQDGIVGKDDVKFNSGYYKLTAKSDTVVGKDSVYIVDGKFDLYSINNSIKTTNTRDYGKGFILIENGDINIASSGQGLKATNSIFIHGGYLYIDAYDDALHTDNHLGILGGTFEIYTGDDAIHADKEVIIDGGKIGIPKCYEGIEAQNITINDGDITIISADDGINAGNSGDDTAGKTNNPTYDKQFKTDENCALSFNGGHTYINASGDGIDSNGYVFFNAGTVVIDGPSNSGNTALDSGLGISIQGGSVIAVGSDDIIEPFSEKSGIANVSVYFGKELDAHTLISIKNSAGEEVMKHHSAKRFSHLSAGSAKFILGDTYTIYINNEPFDSFMILESTTTIDKR